jgi:phosphoribosylformylglycinamidine synthase II
MSEVDLRKTAVELGLRESEYDLIVQTLGRAPTLPELGMYSVMWSEHCGYKHSRQTLKLFKKYKDAIEGEGLENAGVIDIGQRLGVVMKMESHNHPSAIEPYQGAATGVGGILRDIFTMGARPIATLNSLRFGELDDPHVRWLFDGVVAGIAGYGNCVGVPTVAGEVYFDDSYRENCLVNAMNVGLVQLEDVALARAQGPGNPVMIVGSKTGRDGIAGASFASVELGPDSEQRRPNVQMGDPFTEKLLIEATLEALATGHIVGIQDMGAAGITCSTCETSAKAGTGMEIDLAKIPVRETGMTPFEILLSESQERMLCVVAKGYEDEVGGVFRKWGLNAVVAGQVTDSGRVVFRENGRVVVDVPARSLADESPEYPLHAVEPDYAKKIREAGPPHLPEPTDYGAALLELLSRPTIASKRWVWEQYDHQILTNTVLLPGGDAAVLRVKGTSKGLALTTDCNGLYCYVDPYRGGKIAVAEAARNLACVGARAAGVTDCLNFGNPEKDDVAWQFVRCVEGIAEACSFFAAPVVSGNVSFYNESPVAAVYPTPVIGMLGVLDDIEKRMGIAFQEEGDTVILLGTLVPAGATLGASEYARLRLRKPTGPCPEIDLAQERRLHELVLALIGEGVVRSAHDLSEGGLAVALAECCLAGRLGAKLSLPDREHRVLPALFGEAQSRIVVSCPASRTDGVLEAAVRMSVPAVVLGRVGGSTLAIGPCRAGLERMEDAYEGSLPRMMNS